MKRIFALLCCLWIAGPAFAQNFGPQALAPGEATAAQQLVTPQGGGLSSALSVLLGRIVSLDDAPGIHHDGVTDDTGAAQTVLNSVAAQGGGTVLVGPHQYALGVTLNASIQPVSAWYNTSGFTLNLSSGTGANYTVGQSITLTGFTAPLAPLNGTWTVGTVNSTNIVVYTSAMGGNQSTTSTGLGSVYQNLTIPTGVRLVCPKTLSGFPPTGQTYAQQPYTFITGSNSSIVPQTNTGFLGCTEVNSAVANLVLSTGTLRQKLTAQGSFGGTAISVNNTPDVHLEDLLIVGYNVGINSYYSARGRFSRLSIDANSCILTDQSHAPSHYFDVDCGPYATGGGNENVSWPITGVANNGSGLWRVQTTASASLIVGDAVYTNSIVGAGSANGAFIVAAVGSGYVDLAGTIAGGTSSYTGTTTAQSYCLKNMSNTAGIGVGDGITGSNIPASSTVTDVLPAVASICISNQMTGAANNVTITTTPQTYSSGGTLYVDADYRLGKGFSWTNGETNTCVDCSSYAHNVNFYLGAGSSWTTLTNVKVDAYVFEANQNITCFQFDSSSIGSYVSGGSTNSCWTGILGTSSNTNTAHIVTGLVVNSVAGGHTLELNSGRYTVFANTSSGSTPNNFIGDGVSLVGYEANDFQAKWEFQSSTGQNAVNTNANTFASSSVFQGTFKNTGAVSLGGQCGGQFAQCPINILGVLSLAGSGAGAYASYTIPGSNSGWRFTGASGTVASFAVTLPAPIAGQILPVAFDEAVTALSWTSVGGGTVASAPSTIGAGGSVLCFVSNNSTWYCH